MFRKAIEGLDRVIHTEISKGSIILIVGSPGTLKSSFAYALLSKELASKKELGLYLTLEQSKVSHERNIRSLNIELYEDLQIFDYQDIRRDYLEVYGTEDYYGLDIIRGIKDLIQFHRKKEGEKLTAVALDSLNALYSLTHLTHPRIQTYYLFDLFRIHNLTALIVVEKIEGRPLDESYAGEYFLADGIINMGTMRVGNDITIYLQVEKMRATKHSRKKYQLGINEKGLYIVGPEY
jgi:KaiC/GvpD/RAD55 family RecA-like ATPase